MMTRNDRTSIQATDTQASGTGISRCARGLGRGVARSGLVLLVTLSALMLSASVASALTIRVMNVTSSGDGTQLAVGDRVTVGLSIEEDRAPSAAVAFGASARNAARSSAEAAPSVHARVSFIVTAANSLESTLDQSSLADLVFERIGQVRGTRTLVWATNSRPVTAVPEPTAVALFGAGMLLASYALRRRS